MALLSTRNMMLFLVEFIKRSHQRKVFETVMSGLLKLPGVR